MACAHALDCKTQMHKSSPTHILIESSPFLFHVLLCGPHHGLWNGFICVFLCFSPIVTLKELSFSIQRHLCRFYNHTMLFFYFVWSIRTFSSLTSIILPIFILSLSLSPYLPSRCVLICHCPSMCYGQEPLCKIHLNIYS